jgi:hypothetical protein
MQTLVNSKCIDVATPLSVLMITGVYSDVPESGKECKPPVRMSVVSQSAGRQDMSSLTSLIPSSKLEVRHQESPSLVARAPERPVLSRHLRTEPRGQRPASRRPARTTDSAFLPAQRSSSIVEEAECWGDFALPLLELQAAVAQQGRAWAPHE